MEYQQKSKFWKFVLWFISVVVVAFAGLWALGDYQWKRNTEAFEEWAESTKQSFEEFEVRKATDTYGGATPQETLRMYIEAVELGDYELASKYFVLEKQEHVVSGFVGATQENLMSYLNILKGALMREGSYSTAKDSYVIDDPVLVRFELYQSGVWKIIEI